MAITLKDVFTSTPQANYTALAIVIAIVAICLNILLNNNDIGVSEKLVMIITVIVLSLPAILLSLFELSCISNNRVRHSLCSVYGWIISAIIILYCAMVVYISLSSMVTYNSAIAKDQEDKEVSKPPIDTANNMAKEMMSDYNKSNMNMNMKMDTSMKGGMDGNMKGDMVMPPSSSLSPEFGGYVGNEYSSY